MDVLAPTYDHLLALSDHRGTFEQAHAALPLPEHGYSTADMASVLVVTTREPGAGAAVCGLAKVAVRFLDGAQAFSGGCRNHMDSSGRWTDGFVFEDSWGRCLWALGSAAAHSDNGLIRRLAVVQFERAAHGRSKWPRAMAFAAVGAAELLSVEPGNAAARKLIGDYAAGIAESIEDSAWPWPEERLATAGAVLAEAMIAAGVALEDAALSRRGLDLLGLLIERGTADGHLSSTQPIEVSMLADACARASTVDAAAIWPETVRAAAAWFQGDNAAGTLMWDPETGGGFDRLHADGVNADGVNADGVSADGVHADQGAESTLALLSTFQQARRYAVVPD
ncbi:MAG: glycosyltransferase [Mycobacterium sp.]